MNTTSRSDEEITRAFRLQMSHFQCSGYPGHYEYLEGELWYMGQPLENRMTPQERLCLDSVLNFSEEVS